MEAASGLLAEPIVGSLAPFLVPPACDVYCNGGDQEGSLDSLKSVDFENSVGGSVSMAPPFVD